MTVTVALNTGMMKCHKKFRSLTVTVTIARKLGYDEIQQKVQVIVTLSVALNPSMVKYHKKFRSL